MEQLRHFAYMTWPLLVTVFGLVCAFFADHIVAHIGIPSPISIGEVQVDLTGTVGRVILAMASLAPLAFMLCRDYSGLFGGHWSVQTFWGPDDIERAMDEVPSDIIEGLDIPPDWRRRREAYIEELNKIAEGSTSKLQLDPTGLHMTGICKLDFKVSKRRGTLQGYCIDECEGTIVYEGLSPAANDVVLRTQFKLCAQPEASRNITLSLPELLFRFSTVIRPHFKHSIEMAHGPNYVVEMLCVTRLRFWPILSIGKTLHVAMPTAEDGRLRNVPLSYGVNEIS